MQPIDNGTKHKLVVMYSELNESKMSKLNTIFILKFTHSLYWQIYTASDSSK